MDTEIMAIDIQGMVEDLQVDHNNDFATSEPTSHPMVAMIKTHDTQDAQSIQDNQPEPEQEHEYIQEAREDQADVPAHTTQTETNLERVDIPEHLSENEETPHPSPRQPASVQPSPQPSSSQPTPPQVSTSQSTRREYTRPRSFKEHKQALIQMVVDNSWDVELSDESEADGEHRTAVDALLAYFQAHPDLADLYANPNANHVQCPACNKLLGKTVFDVYTYASEARGKHHLIHRRVAAAIRVLYGNEPAPRHCD